MIALAQSRAEDRGLSKYSVPATISRTYYSNVDKELGLSSKQGEKTNEARAKACADIRHAPSVNAAQQLMSTVVQPCLNINKDGTSFNVGKDTKPARKVKVRKVVGVKCKRKTIKCMPEKNADHDN